MDRDTTRLWSEFSERLRAYLRRHLRSSADVEDVLQDVFVRVHRYAGQLDREAHLSGWLFAVTRSALVDFQRRRVKPISAPALEEGEVEVELAEHASIAASLRELVSSLPEGYARAVTLVDLDGLSLKDAADRLGLTLSGAKSRVQRGRRLVRDVLLRCCHFVVDRYGTILEAQPVCCCCAEDRPASSAAAHR